MSKLTMEESQRVVDALHGEFGDDAVVTTMIPDDEDIIPTTIALTSPSFEDVPQMQRQDKVWAVLEKVFGVNAFEKIALVMAYAPSEFESAA